jgi:hypothetical protein
MCGARRPQFDPLRVPETTSPEVQEAIERERELARKRRGRRATILTGPRGVTTPATSGVKTLLGQ